MNTRDEALEATLAAQHKQLREAQVKFEQAPEIGALHPIRILAFVLAAGTGALAVLLILLATGG